jgi:hypothetical protein
MHFLVAAMPPLGYLAFFAPPRLKGADRFQRRDAEIAEKRGEDFALCVKCFLVAVALGSFVVQLP